MAEITLDEFHEEASAFLDAHARRRSEERFVWGEGSDAVDLFKEVSPEEEEAELEAAREWRAVKFDQGFGWITGPEEYGGRGLPRAFEWHWQTLEAAYDVPDQRFFGISLGMVAPTILAHGIPEVRQRYLRRLHRGEMVGCQLFSEPDAGSDVANAKTRAVRDGDEWVVTGQKVWSSGAHYSDIGEVLTRTDPEVPKHQGLTMFLVDMAAPGVEVRPLRQLTGGAHFNEVFFHEVRIPDSHRLGEVNAGWKTAITTLMNERASIGAGGVVDIKLANIPQLVETVRHLGLARDPVTRQGLADLVVKARVLDYTNQRALARVRSGQAPGPELSITKQALSDLMTSTASFVATVLGPRVAADTGEWGTYAWAKFVLGMASMRIAGGTEEIMKNIVGERVLGLPKEPEADRDRAGRRAPVPTV
ncbi:MAG: acyl-CoA dehydrogenase family protein [Acidimicrobiia bacterium]|nr:acyl-CoA dehydrogenase family protein [Acidimicrobiia bacterium]